MKLGQFTFNRVLTSDDDDALWGEDSVQIIGPDVGELVPYRSSIMIPIETLVRYVNKVAKKTKKKAPRKKR